MSGFFDRAAYLDRIGVKTDITPDIAGLRTLHRAHVFTLPFENFDIHLGRGISVEPEDIYEKLVERRRGGYCFELNGLFLQALAAFGFEARALLGRVHVSGQPSGRTHQVSLVEIDGRPWLADVGFGAHALREPMQLDDDAESAQYGGRYRLVAAPPWGTMLQTHLPASAERPAGWSNLYSFDMSAVCQADIETGNHFTSTSPKSFFTMMRIAVLHGEQGKTLLNDFTLSRVTDGVTEQETLEPGAAYCDSLQRHFGIDLGADYDDLEPVGNKPA